MNDQPRRWATALVALGLQFNRVTSKAVNGAVGELGVKFKTARRFRKKLYYVVQAADLVIM